MSEKYEEKKEKWAENLPRKEINALVMRKIGH
jgi:hypothetical protein